MVNQEDYQRSQCLSVFSKPVIAVSYSLHQPASSWQQTYNQKMILTKVNNKFCYRMLFGMIAACQLNSVWADPSNPPKEMNQTFKFEGKDMKGYGAEVNADISRLNLLFGTTASPDAGNTLPGEVPEKSWLGIAMKLPDKLPKEPGTDHVLQAIGVARVMPGSAAEDAGLHDDDLIVGIDGKPIEDKSDKTLLAFRMAVTKKNPGEKVKLRILRNGAILDLEATVKAYPHVTPLLKEQPVAEKRQPGDERSLLDNVLEKAKLTDEFARLRKQIRDETANVVSPLVHDKDYNPFRLQDVNYVLYNPLELPAVARKITNRLHGAFNETRHDLSSLVQTGMDELDMTGIPGNRNDDNPPADMAAYVERLVKAIQHANSERAAVLSVLNKDEFEFLYATDPRLLEGDKESSGNEETKASDREEEARLVRFYQLEMKLDMPRLLNASAEIARALDLDTLVALGKKPIRIDHFPRSWTVRKKKNLTVIDTPAGRVLIGGTGDNIYTEDAALIIDLGGNDKYFNHAGGTTRTNPFSVVIDMSGDDIYASTDDFAQGAGLLGGGFLIDLEGDDIYTAKRFSQGTGILGVGILADLAGRDQYIATAVAQGAGSFGIGILAEGGGNDRYFGNYFVQGVGDTKGFGAIVEAAGNDNYFAGSLVEDFRAPGKSYQTLSQGFGFGVRPENNLAGASGGIGVIAEAEGNDTYVADYFAQGSSYWYALGILDDRKGDDRYIAGRYAQGAGIHYSLGALIDGEGDDNYLADFGVSQGCGHDYGIGFLLDNGGNDRYIAGTLAQGVGNDNGIGVLSDNGGNDEYYLRSLGQGRGNFVTERDEGSFGLLFDTGGGNDVYNQGGKNNSLEFKTQWGILLDTL